MGQWGPGLLVLHAGHIAGPPPDPEGERGVFWSLGTGLGFQEASDLPLAATLPHRAHKRWPCLMHHPQPQPVQAQITLPVSLALTLPARGGRWPGEDPVSRAVGQATEVPSTGMKWVAGHQPGSAHHRVGPLPAGGRGPRCPQPCLALSSKPAWPCWPNDCESQSA